MQYFDPFPPKRGFYHNLAVTFARGVVALAFLLLAYTFYDTAIRAILDEAGIIVSFVLLWLVTAYVILPRVHRFLTRIYLPDYYIGRAKTPEGLLGDPINIAVIGNEQRLRETMLEAGWHEADRITPKTIYKTIKSIALKKSYPNAPISSLKLFDRKQDMAFQIEINDNPRKRHHVRFWKAPKGWYLPGGYEADWLGAAAYDKRVGLSIFTGQFTHAIDENIDEERDYVVHTMQNTDKIKNIHIVPKFTTAYHHRNGGGDSVRTDGAMPFVTLRDSVER